MPILRNGEIILFGYCGWAWDDDGFTASGVMNALAQIDPEQDVTVRINSGGGLADDGLAIYHALRRHRGRVTTVNEAMAASSSSLIFMAGDERIALTASLTMIHEPMFDSWGFDADGMRKAADELDARADEFAAIYADRSGLSVKDVRAMMKTETWMTSQQATDKGFATATQETDAGEPPMIAMFPYEIFRAPPPQIVATARQHGWTPQTAHMGGFFLADRKPAAAPPIKTKETAMSKENGTPDDAALKAARDEATKAAQARMQAIMQSDAAKGRTRMAEHLAFKTSMVADEAIALLEAAPVEPSMVPEPAPGAAPDPAAFEQARMKASPQALPGGSSPTPQAQTMWDNTVKRINARRR